MNLNSILDDWREKASSSNYSKERLKGAAFERLCTVFLTHDPVQKSLYEPPVTYGKWAENQGLDKKDIGIDLVAKIKYSDKFCAIQCKFHAKGKKLSKTDIDSFLAVASQKFFHQRIIIDASGADLTENLKNTLRYQDPEVIHIGLHSLQNSAIDWSRFFNDDFVTLKEKKTPRPHQVEAIKKVVEGLSDKDSRGMLLMACGTGKTFTSLRIAEKLVGVGGYVLYLVPSLGLMSQTVREWASDTRFARFFSVCSDQEVGKPLRERNDYGMDKLDLEFPATTDAKELTSRVKYGTSDQMTVVFATYQSLRVVSEAQQKYDFPDFDLAICDEAHRTSGYYEISEEESSFLIIHNQKNIKADRRLYMTATPKVYTTASRNRASNSKNLVLYSMEDQEVFGDVLYKIGFSKAVDDELLTDFKVIISAVSSGEIPAYVSSAMSEYDLTLDDAGKIVSFWRTLAKIDQEEFAWGENLPMKSAIAYCGTIKDSQMMSNSFQDTIAQYRLKEHTLKIDRRLINHDVDAKHIDGRNSGRQRAESLQWLDNADSGTSRVLFNVRCLSEGVDVPSLDAIIFLRPRRSTIDIAQAVGRVMRKAKGKKVGYVILPVVVPENVAPHEALNSNETFQVIWEVLNALRSHDSGLERDLNLLEAGKAGEGRISILMSKELRYRLQQTDSRGKDDTLGGDDDDVIIQPVIDFDFHAALSAKIVENVGDKLYYPKWAEDIAKIVKNSTSIIEDWVTRHDVAYSVLQEFHKEIQDDLNDGVSEEDAIKILSTHMVTRPVFEILFGKYRFVDKNPIIQGLDTVLKVLEPANIESELEELHDMYESVKMRASNANTPIARQRLIKSLYEEFLKKAFEKESEMFGVIYTPIEVIDFILHSVNEILQEEFGESISSEGVKILDPFTGMGTFIVRLIESGLINKEALPRKYQSEIHANEIMLLPYYLATVNIESAYHQMMEAKEYEPFSGILLTDTFSMNERDNEIADLMPENSDRIKRQKGLGIQVIVGNPPWRVGQKSQNDAAQNQSYSLLRHHIENSYVKHSSSTLTKSLYNSYIQAIRWASDRIGDSGVIGFVTPSNWLVGNAMDGMRKCLGDDFSTIYVLNLGGDTLVDRSANVFDGIKTANAISILVKNPESTEHKILYHEIEHFTDRAKKINRINSLRSIRGLTNQWREINPDRHYDWLNQRDPEFEEFMAIGDKKNPSSETIFKSYSLGVATNRDAWCYNYSEALLRMNVQSMIRFYEGERQRLMERDAQGRRLTPREITDFVDNDPTKISWTVNLKSDLSKNKELSFEEGQVTIAQYRPFTPTRMYFSRRLNERVCQIPQIFPHEEAQNLVICVTGRGEKDSFTCLMVNEIPNLHYIKSGQCFPRWLYKKSNQKAEKNIFNTESTTETDSYGYVRESAINEKALQVFSDKCPPPIFLTTTYSIMSTGFSISLPIGKNMRQTYKNNSPESHSPKMLSSSGYWQMQGENSENSMLATKTPKNIHSPLNREDGSEKMELIQRNGFG